MPQTALCDDLSDVVVGTPAPIRYTAHLKLDPDIDDTVDALEACMVKFDRARELTARLGLTVEQIDELATECETLLSAHSSPHGRTQGVHACLKALVQAGLTTEEVGRLVGLSRSDVIQRLSCRTYTPDEIAARYVCERLARDGVRKTEIAHASGMHRNSVTAYLKLLGLFNAEQAGGPTAPHHSQPRALQLMADGLSNSQVRAQLAAEGIELPSRNCIANWRRRHHARTARPR